MMNEEIHPWQWFAAAGCTTLIAGTFPTAKRNWHYDFFYPNTANLFWNIMAEIAGTKLNCFSDEAAVTERKNILRQLKVALTDMGQKIIRNDGSSLDENLVPLEYMDIFRILDENPSIRKILFTSSSGKASAAGWFNNYLAEKNIFHRFPKEKKPVRSILQYRNRPIELVVLHSPSRRAANRISFEEIVKLYKNEII
jgi:G:T/U-mismatch repair DNA glycosylase